MTKSKRRKKAMDKVTVPEVINQVEWGYRLYFAYGSNLEKTDMKRRCPQSIPIRAAKLKGWKLMFRGVADIERDRDGEVNGALYWITESDEKALDLYEGVGIVGYSYYEKEYVTAELRLPHPISSEMIEGAFRVLVYVMSDDEGTRPPMAYYEGCMRRGYAEWGLNPKAIDRAIKRSPTSKQFAQGSLYGSSSLYGGGYSGYTRYAPYAPKKTDHRYSWIPSQAALRGVSERPTMEEWFVQQQPVVVAPKKAKKKVVEVSAKTKVPPSCGFGPKPVATTTVVAAKPVVIPKPSPYQPELPLAARPKNPAGIVTRVTGYLNRDNWPDFLRPSTKDPFERCEGCGATKYQLHAAFCTEEPEGKGN